LAAEKFEGGAAASGDVGDFVGEAGLMDGGDETLEVIALRSVVLRLTRSSPDKAVSEASAE